MKLWTLATVLLISTLHLLAAVTAFTILDPVSGRVKTDLSQLVKDNEALSRLQQFDETQSNDNGNEPFDTRTGEEYLDRNNRPIYKLIKKYPYAHG